MMMKLSLHHSLFSTVEAIAVVWFVPVLVVVKIDTSNIDPLG